jgi:maltose O-acetyltransferase
MSSQLEYKRRLPPMRSYHFFPWHFLVNVLLASPLVPRRFLPRLLRLAGFDVSPDRVIVRPGVWFSCSDVHIEPGARIGSGSELVAEGGIWIGAHAGIGYGVRLITQTHDIGPPERRWGVPGLTQPIHVGNGVWIGSGVQILPGVTIGDGCVVSAGAVVVRDCEPNGLYFGNPARRLKDLPTDGDDTATDAGSESLA